MNNLAFVVPIHICLLRDSSSLRDWGSGAGGGGGGGDNLPYTCLGQVGKYR